MPNEKLEKLARSSLFAVASSLSSIVGFAWFIYDKFSDKITILSYVAIGLPLLGLGISMLYSLKIRSENFALKEVAHIFCDINRLYRDSLRGMFWWTAPKTAAKEALLEERKILEAVCQRIEQIFAQVINTKCVVTIKLLNTGADGKRYATTYVRSQSHSKRDQGSYINKNFEVGTGVNTGFDHALTVCAGDELPHFHSANLENEKNYSNERANYLKSYLSCIVVPIRSHADGKIGTTDGIDNIGFLSIDTVTTNRLNNNYHVAMLSALANQMYNYISFMRGTYNALVDRPAL